MLEKNLIYTLILANTVVHLQNVNLRAEIVTLKTRVAKNDGLDLIKESGLVAYTEPSPWSELTKLQLPQFITENEINLNKVLSLHGSASHEQDNSRVTFDAPKGSNASVESAKVDGNDSISLPPASIDDQSDNPPAQNQVKNKSDLIKNRIISMTNDTVLDLQIQLKGLDAFHMKYKRNKLYKLGYVVCYLNKTREGVDEFMSYVNKNKEKWEVLPILNAYEKIKKAKEFISESMAILKQVENPPIGQVTSHPGMEKKRVGLHPAEIAWSYYDDNI